MGLTTYPIMDCSQLPIIEITKPFDFSCVKLNIEAPFQSAFFQHNEIHRVSFTTLFLPAPVCFCVFSPYMVLELLYGTTSKTQYNTFAWIDLDNRNDMYSEEEMENLSSFTSNEAQNQNLLPSMSNNITGKYSIEKLTNHNYGNKLINQLYLMKSIVFIQLYANNIQSYHYQQQINTMLHFKHNYTL